MGHEISFSKTNGATFIDNMMYKYITYYVEMKKV